MAFGFNGGSNCAPVKSTNSSVVGADINGAVAEAERPKTVRLMNGVEYPMGPNGGALTGYPIAASQGHAFQNGPR